MNIAIVDDQKKDGDYLYDHIYRAMQDASIKVQINRYDSGEEFLKLEPIGSLDLVFLDIIMSGISGIDTARKIREHNPECSIVFVSSSNHFAAESYQVNALRYITKPYSSSDIDGSIDKIIKDYELSSQYIEVTENRKRIQIGIQDILFVDYYHHAVLFHTESSVIKTYSVRFSEIEEALLVQPCFITCGKNLVVNMDKVLQIENRQFVICDGTPIPISRTIYSQVKNNYTDYIFKKLREEQN